MYMYLNLCVLFNNLSVYTMNNNCAPVNHELEHIFCMNQYMYQYIQFLLLINFLLHNLHSETYHKMYPSPLNLDVICDNFERSQEVRSLKTSKDLTKNGEEKII